MFGIQPRNVHILTNDAYDEQCCQIYLLGFDL
jgi:hypothetical protein